MPEDNPPSPMDQPVGTPPAGGRWTWNGAWVALPETDEAAAPAAAVATTIPKE